MGIIEEVRQPFQDFSDAEVRAIDARLDNIERKFDRNESQVIETPHRSEIYTRVMERLARLESKIQNVA